MTGDLKPVACIVASTTDPTWFRARCSLCPWASHVGGTTHDLAVAAATAHVENTHRATHVQVAPGDWSPA